MKAEALRTVGSTIFWVFFVSASVIDITTYATGHSDLWILIMRRVFAGFELFGISLEIAGWRIAKKEQKKLKENKSKDNE